VGVQFINTVTSVGRGDALKRNKEKVHAGCIKCSGQEQEGTMEISGESNREQIPC